MLSLGGTVFSRLPGFKMVFSIAYINLQIYYAAILSFAAHTLFFKIVLYQLNGHDKHANIKDKISALFLDVGNYQLSMGVFFLDLGLVCCC
jgi:hypothetical protein